LKNEIRGKIENELENYFKYMINSEVQYWKNEQIKENIDSPSSALMGELWMYLFITYRNEILKNPQNSNINLNEIFDFKIWIDSKMPIIKDQIMLELNK